MTCRDNRDIRGHDQIVPMQGRGDTTGHPRRGGVPVSPPAPAASTAERLRRLSRRLGRLSPNWRDPEAFFEERSEIECELRRISRLVADG